MITYESALEKAKTLKPNIDSCTEYDNAYVFGCSTDDGEGSSPVVVLKEDGREVTFPWYMIRCCGKEIKMFKI